MSAFRLYKLSLDLMNFFLNRNPHYFLLLWAILTQKSMTVHHFYSYKYEEITTLTKVPEIVNIISVIFEYIFIFFISF